MAAGDVTQGRRIADGEMPSYQFPPAGYGRINLDGEWTWMCNTPNGHLGNLRLHDVMEHEDGTITVSPSILVDRVGTGEGWHGYLERGVWREV